MLTLFVLSKLRSVWLGYSVVVMSACFAMSGAYATTYTKAINNEGWRSESSVFECRVVHTIPFYGEVVFRKRAGESSSFYLRSQTSRFRAGEAEITVHPPVWKPKGRTYNLGKAPVKKGLTPVYLGDLWAERMLVHLSHGREVQIAGLTWYDNIRHITDLDITPIGFRKAYDEYLACLASLIPRNFDQLKRTALYFTPGEQEELSPGAQRKLDQILALVKHDNKVRLFYIDGHTDSAGDRNENLELSKKRAELVNAYLTRRGIPEDWIKLRWHGERYPATSNNTASGRAKNRRVTIRLERVEEIEVLPLASATN